VPCRGVESQISRQPNHVRQEPSSLFARCLLLLPSSSDRCFKFRRDAQQLGPDRTTTLVRHLTARRLDTVMAICHAIQTAKS